MTQAQGIRCASSLLAASWNDGDGGWRDGAAVGKHRRRCLIRQMAEARQQRTLKPERDGYGRKQRNNFL